jgi:hypothetical protein
VVGRLAKGHFGVARGWRSLRRERRLAGLEALVDFAGEEKFGPAAGTRPGTSQRDLPTTATSIVVEVADEEEFEGLAVETVRADDEMLGGL